jgi:diacylglycerol kinase (ATP)
VSHIAVLRNPAAGRGRHAEAVRRALAALESPQRTVRVLDARTVEAALVATREAVAGGAAALVTVGGDGTIHIGLQAVAGTGVPFGVIPAGTGNDFAAESGIPADPVAAASAIAAALDEGRTRPVDLAHLAGPGGYERYFGAVLGAGFDAIVNERANAMRWPKGRRRYDIAIFAELMRLRPRRYRLTLDGETTELDAVLIAIGNTASYGGGMRMCPDADPADGLLDVVVAGPISRTTLLRLQPRVYRGTHVGHDAVRTFRARSVGLACTEPITAYADGERACPLPITVTAAPAALALLA